MGFLYSSSLLFVLLLVVGYSLGNVVLEVGVLLPLTTSTSAESCSIASSTQWQSVLQMAASSSPSSVTINLHIKDSRCTFTDVVSQCMALIDEGVNVVIGEINSDYSASIQQFLAAQKVYSFFKVLLGILFGIKRTKLQIPQIVPLSPSTLLLNKERYPYLIQTTPSNAQQVCYILHNNLNEMKCLSITL